MAEQVHIAGTASPKRRSNPENGLLLPKVFMAYPHNPGAYLQIAPPNVEAVLLQNPGMTRESIQEAYKQEKLRLSVDTEEEVKRHKYLVREFANFLAGSGIAVAYDQLLEDTGTDNLMKWTEQQMKDSDYVILIVTPSLCDFLSSPPPRDKEYIFSGHMLYNLIHSPPPRPNSPVNVDALRFLPVFLNSTKNLNLLPKTLEAGNCYEIWKPFDVRLTREDDLVSLYTLLTRQSTCAAPPPTTTYVKIKPKRSRFGAGVIDPSMMTQEQQTAYQYLITCPQQLSEATFIALSEKADFAANWKTLASRLGLGEAVIERIEGWAVEDREEACLQMLRQWKEMRQEATVAVMVEAIMKIKNFPLLELLYKVFR